MRVAFVVNARNKSQYVGRAVRSAMSQTHPCEILLSDQGSTDGTYEAMESAVNSSTTGANHTIKLLRCPIEGPFCMAMANAHFDWLCDQVAPDTEYIFQCSGDDYSLPMRVSVCMEAVDKIIKDCSVGPACVACTMYFEEPGTTNRQSVSGYPKETGFVSAADGLTNLAYGSTIHGWNVDFIKKTKHFPGNSTPDVVLGFLASLDVRGFYVVCNPQHCHVTHASLGNLGFQGKLRAAQGENSLLYTELNHMQLFALYDTCLMSAYELHPEGLPNDAFQSVVNIMMGQAKAWLEARKRLNEHKLRPLVLE